MDWLINQTNLTVCKKHSFVINNKNAKYNCRNIIIDDLLVCDSIQTSIPIIQTINPIISTTNPMIQTTLPLIQTTIPRILATIPQIETTIPIIWTTIPQI